MAAEEKWEREHAAEIRTGCSSSISRCVCKQKPSDELSQLRRENEELKAAKMNAEATELARLREKVTDLESKLGEAQYIIRNVWYGKIQISQHGHFTAVKAALEGK